MSMQPVQWSGYLALVMVMLLFGLVGMIFRKRGWGSLLWGGCGWMILLLVVINQLNEFRLGHWTIKAGAITEVVVDGRHTDGTPVSEFATTEKTPYWIRLAMSLFLHMAMIYIVVFEFAMPFIREYRK